MNKKYTHIFFDLDNTLWDFETNSRNALLVAFNNFELAVKTEFDHFHKVYEKHNKSLWELYRKNEIAKKELVFQRFNLTFSELGIAGVDAVKMNSYYLEVMPEQKLLAEGATELLQYLKRKSYKLSVITNGFREVQMRKIETSGLKPFITNVYISEVVKIQKPNREIFEYAIKSSNAPKRSSVMIGDDWEVDIMGAAAFGIDSVFVTNDQNASLTSVENSINSKCKIYKTGSLKLLNCLF